MSNIAVDREKLLLLYPALSTLPPRLLALGRRIMVAVPPKRGISLPPRGWLKAVIWRVL
jgi:hypothetical protein